MRDVSGRDLCDSGEEYVTTCWEHDDGPSGLIKSE
jgi:hypothetical protein